MHPITAWMAQRLYYLFVILHFATTAIMYSSQALIHAHPIVAHKEPLPSPHPALFPRQAEVWTIFTPPAGSTPSSTPTSDNPSLTLPSPSPTSTDTPVTVIQKPLVQIVSPNVTFFAALDIVSSGSPSAFPTQYPTLPPLPANDNNTSHIPLLLPVSSLSILPNQIYHVDDERMFGAGGPDPLTGILVEWTAGCVFNRSALDVPVGNPWIAFMSSRLLTYSNSTNSTTNPSPTSTTEDGNCNISKMITILQAISGDVSGVVVYQDANATVPFSEVKRQTEEAIRRNFLIQGPSVRLNPVRPGTSTGGKFGSHFLMRRRAFEGLSRDAVMQRAAEIEELNRKETLKRSILHKRDDHDSRGGSGHNQWDGVTTTSTISPIFGIMALTDPTMISILQQNAAPMDQAVIARITFANNPFGPNLPLTPTDVSTPSPTSEAERPAADRSLGVFFWVILGSVVLIIGVWVGFGVAEARTLSRRRQQIALDNRKLRTVDQDVLNTYKTRIFQEDDISYMDVNDDDDDESNGSGVGVSRAASNRSRRSRLSVLIHGQGPRDNDTRQAEEGRHTRGEKNPNSRSLRFFPRIDLPRFPGTLRSGHSDAPALGRRSGSFNDGVFGKRESGQSGNPAGGRDSLNRDDRCHTWTEHKHEMSGDNGGESLDVRGFDQESRSRAGSTGRQSEKAQAMDGTELPAMPPLVVIREDGSGATSTAGSLHSRPSLRQQGTSQVSFPSDPSGADDGSAPSAGPSTAGFVTPEDWDGEHRRSSISTVAVPDNGRGLPRANSTGSQKKVQRKSSLYITTPAPQSNEGEGPGESTEEEAHQHDGGKSSEEDDGRGVGRIDASAFSNKHRRISQMDLEDDDDDLAESSKDATPDLPYFYSDGGGVLDAIGIHPEDYAPSNSRSNSIRSKRSTKGGAISRSSTRSSITGSQRPRQHDKELTSTTAHTAVASTSGEVTTTNAKKVKNKASGPKQRTRKYDPCAICLEEYEVGDHIRELPCKHFFHSQCIDPWFRDVHGICPVCKRDYSQAGGTDAPGGQAQEGEPRVSTFLSPLALFAGAGAGHYWYAAEASMYM